MLAAERTEFMEKKTKENPSFHRGLWVELRLAHQNRHSPEQGTIPRSGLLSEVVQPAVVEQCVESSGKSVQAYHRNQLVSCYTLPR